MTNTLAITNPSVIEQPFSVQVQRGEQEAYGLVVGTFWGRRNLRLFRYTDDYGNSYWVCHPNNELAGSLWSGRGETPQQAVDACMRTLAV